MHLKEHYGVMPNDWLIRHPNHLHHLATPDGLTLGHNAIAEIKTTGKDWNPERIPVQYRRQVQWQLHVTEAEFSYFAWLLREERDGAFMPAWFEPKVITIERDEVMIRSLMQVADGCGKGCAMSDVVVTVEIGREEYAYLALRRLTLNVSL
jgi:hypothetical protein